MLMTIKVYCSPTQVKDFAKRLGMSEGTSSVYSKEYHASYDDAYFATLDKISAAGISGYTSRDIHLISWQ